MNKHLLNTISGVLFATLFIYLTFRNKPIGEIGGLLQAARINWILFGVGLLIAVFFMRALRWKLLLSNTGENPGFRDVSYSLLLGFFVNSFTPKLGEIVRCTTLRKRTDIAVSKSLGTVISERIYDLMVLVAGVVLIILFESDRLNELLSSSVKNLIRYLTENLLRLVLFILIILLATAITWYLAGKFSLREKIRSFFRNLYDTARMTFRIRSYRNFALQTITIWGLMIVLNYCCLKALPSTDGLSFYFAMVALFIGSIGWAIPSPGGIGTSHFFVLQLFLLFNLNESAGVAYGLLVNGLIVLFTIGGGLIAIIIVAIFRFARKSN
ncbi:MAG TPA: lysylphosphatidylglycerol synthase transmembrane domain-containing protein [Bacteroidales bacterium]|nr:lysylphosphatidylglycerol synthase transmembrane domain-containing protein [Bacteroidales bacterium]